MEDKDSHKQRRPRHALSRVLWVSLLAAAAVLVLFRRGAVRKTAHHLRGGSPGVHIGPKQFRSCHNAFVDLGTNVGDSITKFLRPGDFPRSDVANMVLAVGAKPSEYCVFGFEGNPLFTKRLKQLEAKHRPEVEEIFVFTETVVSDADGTITFYPDTTYADANFWGSSTMKSHSMVNVSAAFTSQALDFTSMLRSLSTEVRKHQGKVLVKMDIEGAEFGVLQKLAARNMLCGHIDYWILEYHSHLVAGSAPQNVEGVLDWVFQRPECGVVVVKGHR